jgi:hypothetical protein
MTGRSLARWLTGRVALCALGAVLALAVTPGGTALGAETHAFDPTLSLTGGCGTSLSDEVPDPGCPGGLHPPQPFSSPRSVATDSYGNIFVASFGQKEGGPESGIEGHVDIFDSSGFFITELAVPSGPRMIATDSEGNLYVANYKAELLRYIPSLYEPASGKIEYETTPKVVAGESPAGFVGIAVNPADDRVFANYGNGYGGGKPGEFISEYGSAAEGNKFIETIGAGTLGAPNGFGLTIDASRNRIYATDVKLSPVSYVIRVFNLEAPHALIETIDGSTTPAGKFVGFPSIAVEESTGYLFAYDGGGAEVVYELTEKGEYIATIDHGLQGHHSFGAQIAVDNGKNSPNGALDPLGNSYLYVPAYPTATGHSFAFGPPGRGKPAIESVSFSGVTETEAQLHAEVNPHYFDTTYVFEYTTEENFEAEGFEGAAVAGGGELPAAGSPVKLNAALEGLEPGTAYRFRVIAENEAGGDEEEGEFATYIEAEPSPPCLNDGFRTGPSKLLPDCRAYELVTPPDTNALSPRGVAGFGTYFATRQASPAGDAVSFEIEGGALPGGGTGFLAGDPYLASRTGDGWSTTYAGPSALESPALLPGSNSPDQGYSLWSTASSEGSAAIEEKVTEYIHYPDGHSALVGRGSLGTDPRAVGKLISENGGHIVFVSGGNSPAVQLEPNAPPSGTRTVYDRTIDPETGEEETHVVSLLPGDVTPAEGETSEYEGASLDGKGIAFSIGKTLYLRYEDEETYEVAKEATFDGVSEGGRRVFFLKGGNLFAFDIEAEETIQFTESGDVIPVNLAAGGRVAYFVSPTALTSEPNPNGDEPVKGEENLYRSEEGAIDFVGTVTKRDVEGEFGGVLTAGGLGLWTEAVGHGQSSTFAPGRFGIDPSRTTPDGSVFVFESRARLTGYDSEGHAEVYRYDAAAGTLGCLSCNPTLAPATGEASLQSVRQEKGDEEPFGPYGFVASLRADGNRAFFQSTEPLVPGDTDELQDVYEWEAQGVGTCERPEGCLYLISSGRSLRTDYIYAVSDSGDDVFFRSSDLLLASDGDETPSIYDARVGGGFPQPEEAEGCQGESCRPTISPPPPMLIPESGVHVPGGEERLCPKGKRRVTRNGKVICVKKKHHKHHRHQKGTRKKGAGK